MDPARFERYVDKLDHARDRLALVAAWSPKAREGTHWRLATYKAFQEAAEALADLIAMATVDTGHAAKDDYRNLDLAADEGVIDPDRVEDLAETTGLRNRLVHEYETMDDEIALTSIQELSEPLEGALAEVEGWLRSMN